MRHLNLLYCILEMPWAKAVFLDRDGVLIEEVNYLRHIKQLRLLPGAARAVARLRAAGWKAVVVTNQSGVARGYVSRTGLTRIHRELRRRLKAAGARLDGLYFCPHHPDFGRARKCRCRKPGIALLEAAKKRFKLDLKASVFVGDTTTDMRTARNAGCRAVLVRTGKGGKDGAYKAAPHKICADLAGAADWILRTGAAA